MERTRLIVNFDSSCDKLLSTENVVARGETFDILFRDVTLSGTVRVAFWDYDTLLWRSEGSASQGDGGSVLEGLVADTKELADVFRGGSGFFAARLTVGEQVGGDEWRDYGVAYVRLYSGTDPSENPPPARPDVYPTEEELNAWLEAAGEVREGVCTCAKAAASSAEAAASSATAAAKSATAAQEAAEKVGNFSDHLEDHSNPHRVTAAQVGAVPLLGAGESADPATHGKTALVTQNGDEGGFAVAGKQGAKPEDDAFVTKYQRESITAFGGGADSTAVERYLIGPQNRNRDESILRVGDLAGTKPVTVTPESVSYVQKVTLALQIDRETLAHATAKDAIDWVPSSKAVQAALDQKADAAEVYKKAETYSKAEVNEKDASTLAEAKAYADGKVVDVYRFKGSVATEAALPKTGNVTGDVWNVSEDGMNYAWTGEEWDALGTSVDLSAYYTKTESDGRYLKLDGGTLQKGATITIPYSGNVNIHGLRTRLIRGVKGNDATINGAIFLNYHNTTVPTEVYLKDVVATEERDSVFIAGWGEEALVLRKCDCDYLYAPKTHAHSDYLSLSLTDWQHIKGPISFDYHDTRTASVNITSINGVSSGNGVVEHGRLYINSVPSLNTNDYLNGMRQVMIAGHPALRKIDGDTLYAAKADVYTKAQVDEKITSALGDIQSALEAI